MLHDDLEEGEDAETIADIYGTDEREWEHLANEKLAWYGFRLGAREMSDHGVISYRLEAA